MKRLLTQLLIVLLLFPQPVISQPCHEGLYITAADFETNTLSYKKNVAKKYKLHVRENSVKRRVTVKIGDSTYRFAKDSIFEYCQYNQQYRLFNGKAYAVVAVSKKLLLYCRKVLGGYKRTQLISHYYFSSCTTCNIYQLSLHNLKLVYKKQPEVVSQLDIHFSDEDQLTAVDHETSQYKLVQTIK